MLTFIQANGAVLVFIAVAFIVSMPDDPPANLRALPAWAYRWLKSSLQIFVSMRGPKAPAPPAPPAPPKLTP